MSGELLYDPDKVRERIVTDEAEAAELRDRAEELTDRARQAEREAFDKLNEAYNLRSLLKADGIEEPAALASA